MPDGEDSDPTDPNVPNGIPVSGKEVLFVKNGYYQQEEELQGHLETLGFVVTVKADYQISGGTDLTPYDLIILTGFAPNVYGSGMTNIKDSGIPIFVIEYWDFIYSAKLDLVDDQWSGTKYDSIVEMTSYSHVITEPFGYDEIVYDSNGVLLGTPMYVIEPGVTPLNNQAALIVDDTRGIVASGIHVALRYTDIGWEIVDRSLAYLLGTI